MSRAARRCIGSSCAVMTTTGGAGAGNRQLALQVEAVHVRQMNVENEAICFARLVVGKQRRCRR